VTRLDCELLVAGHRLPVSSLHKQMFPRAGFTKADLIDYYRRVAHVLAPHTAGRPMTLGRFPDGVEGRGFAQTECPGRPEWLPTHALKLRGGGRRRYCLLGDEAALVWAANLATIELHPYPWRVQRPEQPDLLLLDLDPGEGAGLADCCRVALLVRDDLSALGLPAVVKTSGGGGLHVVVPLDPVHTFEETKNFARLLARDLGVHHPELVTASSSRAARSGRVFIDWAQNDARRSTVAPYSLRAADYPLVSTPVGWDEVEDAPDALWFEAHEVLERVERHGDLHLEAISGAGRARLPS
jgi:bifunctional non-homologous end joining protein LigD